MFVHTIYVLYTTYNTYYNLKQSCKFECFLRTRVHPSRNFLSSHIDFLSFNKTFMFVRTRPQITPAIVFKSGYTPPPLPPILLDLFVQFLCFCLGWNIKVYIYTCVCR